MTTKERTWPAVVALDGRVWADNRIAIDGICRMRLRDTKPDTVDVYTFSHWCWTLLGWPKEEAWPAHLQLR